MNKFFELRTQNSELRTQNFKQINTLAESIGSVIRQWLRENNLEQKVQEQTVPEYWTEIIGETLAKHATVERIDKGKMFISVENAVWRSEIAIRRDEIREKVNAHFGSDIIQEIVVR